MSEQAVEYLYELQARSRESQSLGDFEPVLLEGWKRGRGTLQEITQLLLEVANGVTPPWEYRILQHRREFTEVTTVWDGLEGE